MTAFYYFCGHEQWQPETLVRHAVIAEHVGFDGLLVSEHFHPWVDDRSAAGFAFATIGAIAQATSRVRIATGVTTPLFRYHPGVVAQAAATLDRLSGGPLRPGRRHRGEHQRGPARPAVPRIRRAGCSHARGAADHAAPARR